MLSCDIEEGTHWMDVKMDIVLDVSGKTWGQPLSPCRPQKDIVQWETRL